jgi:structural maintenance of chromosome 2
LEKTAGGKLFNVVVENDQIGKALLQSGNLKRKITIIPMNKIKATVVPDRTLKMAQEIVGADMVHSALTLIEFDPLFKNVMEYVFGNKLVCTTLMAAKQVAFNQRIATNAVTLEGNIDFSHIGNFFPTKSKNLLGGWRIFFLSSNKKKKLFLEKNY